MKRSQLTLSTALAAALLSMGCPTDTPSESSVMDSLDSAVDYTVTAGTNLSLDGDSLVLAEDDRYVADLGGIACTFASGAGEYTDAFVITLADVTGVTDYDSVVVVANVYTGETLIDLSSDYDRRVYGKVDAAESGANYNMGTNDQTLSFTSSAATLNFGRKKADVSLIVIKSVTFRSSTPL